MVIRSSHLARVMQCPGSMFFENVPEPPTNAAAEEGTAAAECLEHFINKGQPPQQTHASNGIAFDDDMLFHAKRIADEVMGKAHEAPKGEHPIEIPCRSGAKVQGTYDIAFVGEQGQTLFVDDLKYGFGIVEPEENWQLIAYAIGEIIKRGVAYPNIVLRIHQPRAHHEFGTTREWRITYEDLLGYYEQIESQMDSLMQGYDELKTGPKCKYCPVATHCPAFNKAYHRGIDIVQEFIQDDLSNDELSYQLDLLDKIQDLVKTRKQSLEQLAVHRIGQGEMIPDYAAVDNYGHRSWKSNVTPEFVQLVTGVNIKKEDVLTPSQAEKRGIPSEVINNMVERKFLGQKVKKVDSSKLGDKIFGKG